MGLIFRPVRVTLHVMELPMNIHRTVKDKVQANRDRVAKRRAALRAQGLRPKQIWVPDTRAPGFWEAIAEGCKRIAADPATEEVLQWAKPMQYWPPDDPD